MTCNFRVGQKVVCVNAEWDDDPSPLAEGRMYTVSGFEHLVGYYPPTGTIEKATAIILVEVINPGAFCGFHPDRFRPVVERKTDISIFKAMLNPKKEQVRA